MPKIKLDPKQKLRPLTKAEMAKLSPEDRAEEAAGLRTGALRRLKAHQR